MSEEDTSPGSSTALEVRFVSTDEDTLAMMLAASDFLKPPYRRRLTRSILLQLFLLVIGATLIALDTAPWYGWLMIGYGLSGILIWGPMLAYPKRQIAKRINLLGIIGEETESLVSMDSVLVTFSTNNFTLTLGWEIIDTVDSGNDYLRFVSKQGLIQVPLRAFDNNVSRDSFTDTAARYHSLARAAA